MKHYAGLDLLMDSTQVCIVNEDGGKVASVKVESTLTRSHVRWIESATLSGR